MNELSERKRITKELLDLEIMGNDFNSVTLSKFIDWVLLDRRRIVEPLVKIEQQTYALETIRVQREAIDETIKRAAIN